MKTSEYPVIFTNPANGATQIEWQPTWVDHDDNVVAMSREDDCPEEATVQWSIYIRSRKGGEAHCVGDFVDKLAVMTMLVELFGMTGLEDPLPDGKFKRTPFDEDGQRLMYRHDPGFWSFYSQEDKEEPRRCGPQYPTERDLRDDMQRYGHEYGFSNAYPPRCKVQVKYWGDTEPQIETLNGFAEIELIDGDAEDEHYFTHGDVSIYHTTNDCDVLSDYWFSVYPRTNRDSDIAFDVRDLPGIPPQLEEKYGALYPEEDVFQTLAYCIDAGYINEDGYDRDHVPESATA